MGVSLEMSTQFQYRGTLEETSLAEMFCTILRHRVPGLIEISNDGVVKRLYINDGSVIHAKSSDKSDRLGAHLYRLGKLSRQDLSETMRIRDETGENVRHGEILISKNLLSPSELYQAICDQMESIVWSVFGWQQGEVTFKIGEFDEPEMIKIHMPMRQVILRGIQRIPDTKGLVAKMGRKSTIYKPCYELETLIEIALDAEEYKLLRLVDGQRTLYDICTDGPYGVSENARLLYAFHVLSLIERSDGESGVKIRMNATGTPATEGGELSEAS